MNTGALIFGEVGMGSAAACRDIWFGTEAYERYQLPNYMQEIIRIKTEPGYICAWGNFEYLYYALELLGSNAFVEVGSTLFASIDKLQKCRRLAGHNDEFGQVHFYGVEPSALLRQTAEILHTDAQLSHVNEPGLPGEQQKTDRKVISINILRVRFHGNSGRLDRGFRILATRHLVFCSRCAGKP